VRSVDIFERRNEQAWPALAASSESSVIGTSSNNSSLPRSISFGQKIRIEKYSEENKSLNKRGINTRSGTKMHKEYNEATFGFVT
jgi:hypothetical protein